MLNMGAVERPRQVFGHGLWAAQHLEACACGFNQPSLIYILGVFTVDRRGITGKQHHGRARLDAFNQGRDGVC